MLGSGVVTNVYSRHIQHMRPLIFILTIIILYGNPAKSAEWTAVSANHHATYYVNEGSIKGKEGYVYFWDMGNLLSPLGEGVVSVRSFNKADCNEFLIKILKTSFHKKSMASDKAEILPIDKPIWKTPPSSSASAKILEFVCKF